MRRSSLLAALLGLTVLSSLARGQAYVPEDNLAYPVQVVVPDGGGTGFFVRKDQNLFLVTARHVIYDIIKRQLAPEFTLRALSKDLHETAVTVMHVNDVQIENEKQIRMDAPRDVAVIHLATLRSGGMDTTAGVVVSERSKGGIITAPFAFLTRFSDVDVSSQIFMFGYPSIGVKGYSQIDPSRPLVRGGIVSGLNATLKTIIIDAPVYHGNSGGPVVQLSRTNRLKIIGIATQFVPVAEEVLPLNRLDVPQGTEPAAPNVMALGNSGYSVVASADAIIDLINGF